MAELIDREATYEVLTAYYHHKTDIQHNALREALNKVPSAQPEAKHPKWVAEDRFIKNHFSVYPHCPQCNAEVITGDCYCRICGQHIDWSEDDE